MRIEYLGDSHSARWDSYVAARAWAVTDLFAWRHVARESYGIASHFLLAEDNGVSAGALALYEIRHPVFGHYLATALFGTDGGLFSDSDAARDALARLGHRPDARAEVLAPHEFAELAAALGDDALAGANGVAGPA